MFDHPKPPSMRGYEILNRIVDSGILAQLTALEVRVLMVYLRHADNRNGKAYPSVERIARLVCKSADNSESYVRKAIRKLEKKKLLVCISRGGGRRKPSTYILRPPEGLVIHPDSRGENGSAKTGVNGVHSSGKGVDFDGKGGEVSCQTGLDSHPRTTGTTQETTKGTTHLSLPPAAGSAPPRGDAEGEAVVFVGDEPDRQTTTASAPSPNPSHPLEGLERPAWYEGESTPGGLRFAATWISLVWGGRVPPGMDETLFVSVSQWADFGYEPHTDELVARLTSDAPALRDMLASDPDLCPSVWLGTQIQSQNIGGPSSMAPHPDPREMFADIEF